MGVSTTSAAVHITPVVIKTFLNHYRKKTKKNAHYYVTAQEGEGWKDDAKDELIFDEAFHIVKAFIELGTQNSIESLQAFTNTHIPSPYWVAVAPVLIPLQTCNRAADVLIEWFGPEDLSKVVGGERWWQVRGLDGVEGEWITEKTFLGELDKKSQKHKTETDELIGKMDHLEPVMFYVHGGGYFWGSINTHRYQTIRYAKKMKGRCFMVNYRKAPQYPWPCPIHDVLAAYLYLIDPPADAPHKPISPSKIVFAGDSAGGALCLSVLTVLRDMGIPLPSGAVLISPWVDLTHSFESVMTNTKTDIIPPHGFVHKPSMLWPVRPLADETNPRIRQTQTNMPPQPGHADTLDPSAQRVEEQDALREEARRSNIRVSEVEARHTSESELKPQKDMLRDAGVHSRDLAGDATSGSDQSTRYSSPNLEGSSGGAEVTEEDLDRWEPKPPKVLMNDPDAVPLEVLSQIQQYAMNEQLSHPLVSPILQGSLCNLCPLYIIAGNGEVLRDEIVHIAHRAAHPTEYPVRKGVLKEGRRQRENVEKFTTPTKVHLQLYDDMPHVLTVFTFAACAKYAYRAIAQFARHVTVHPPEHIVRNPFPELHRPECAIHTDGKPGPASGDDAHGERWGFCCTGSSFGRRKPAPPSPTGDVEEDLTGIKLYKENERQVAEQVEERDEGQTEVEEGHQDQPEEVARRNERVPSAQEEDIPHVLMIRERVDIHGRVRTMEPAEDMAALRIKLSTVGLIKEAPVLRWYAGQEAMDHKYAAHARTVVRRRKKMEERVERMITEAYKQGFIHADDSTISGPVESNGHARLGSDGSAPALSSTPSGMGSVGALRPKRKTVVRVASTDTQMSTLSVDTVSGSVKIDEFRRWGPLDLESERPPPSAIAGRRDTVEALALIKRHIYHTAPVTHKTVPKMKASHVVRAALDPHDRVSTKPMQSVSEEQTRSKINPMHGLSIWGSLVSYFMRKTSHTVADNVRDGVDNVRDGVGNVRDGVRNIGTGASHSESMPF